MYQNLNGSVTMANPAAEQILGLSLKEMGDLRLGDPRWRTINEDLTPFQKDEFPYVIAFRTGKQVTNVVMGIINQQDKTYRWILVDAVPQFHLNDQLPFQVFTTFADITARKKAEEEFVQLNKNLEELVVERTSDLESFTYSVAHDLRAPLRGIEGFSGILEEDYGKTLDDEGKKVIRHIRDNVQHMDKLMEGLLEFSRMGRSEVLRTSFDMRGVVEECYQNLTTAETRDNIRFSIDSLCLVHADRSMMIHIWSNLLSNAIKFSGLREVPEIHISVAFDKDEAVFSIHDNGVGFDMRYKEKLFAVFQRLHTTREFSGTGVGLAIVYRFIQRHNGKIWAESEVDKGTTFFFTVGKGN